MSGFDLDAWFKRNWKWFIPTAVLGLVVAFAALALGIVLIVFTAIKSSGAYTGALERVRHDAAVQEQLGGPIEAGWYVTGNINVNGSEGWAALAFPVSGPAREGTVYLEARKRQGQWTFGYLAVEVDGQPDRIVLADTDP